MEYKNVMDRDFLNDVQKAVIRNSYDFDRQFLALYETLKEHGALKVVCRKAGLSESSPKNWTRQGNVRGQLTVVRDFLKSMGLDIAIVVKEVE